MVFLRNMFPNIQLVYISSFLLYNLKKTIINIISPELTMSEGFKNLICTLDEQICSVKTSDLSQINPNKFLYKTAFAVKIPDLAGRSL